MYPSFDWERCIGCLACVRVCRGGALSYSDREGVRRITFEPRLCDGDFLCAEICPVKAVKPGEKPLKSSATFELARCERCGKLTEFTLKEVEWAKKKGYYDVFLCKECRKAFSAEKILSEGSV
ncbi:indolepyruvate ferredoxin oxidoreductase subunit alpha [Thermococcus sp.]